MDSYQKNLENNISQKDTIGVKTDDLLSSSVLFPLAQVRKRNKTKARYELIDELYTENTWNKYQEKITKLIRERFNHFPKNLLDDREKLLTELNVLDKGYKKSYSFIKHFFIILTIPLAFLFFVYPGILLLRTSKKMSGVKDNFKKMISDKEEQIKVYNKSILRFIQPFNLYQIFCKEIVKWHDMGPINSGLINFLKNDLRLENISYFKNNKYQNTLNTNWGYFNNNIVINSIVKTHKMVPRTYSGSVLVSYETTNSKRERVTRAELVVAHYDHDFPRYFRNKNFYCLSERNRELEFYYNKFYKDILFDRKKNEPNEIPLENPEFMKHYDFNWNDNLKIRNVFTPFVQEKFVEVGSNKDLPIFFKLKKKSLFYSHDFSHKSFFYSWNSFENLYSDFKNNSRYQYSDFQNDFISSILSLIKARFDALAFMTILPTITTEDQVSEINFIINDNSNNDSNEIKKIKIFYLLNQFYGQKYLRDNQIFTKYDTQFMQYIDEDGIVEKKSEDNILLNFVTLKNFSYKSSLKVKHITKYAMAAQRAVTIPVEYLDFEIKDDVRIFVYTEIRDDIYFNDLERNNLDEKTLSALSQWMHENNDVLSTFTLKIREGYLCVFLHRSLKKAQGLQVQNSSIQELIGKTFKRLLKIVHLLNNDVTIANSFQRTEDILSQTALVSRNLQSNNSLILSNDKIKKRSSKEPESKWSKFIKSRFEGDADFKDVVKQESGNLDDEEYSFKELNSDVYLHGSFLFTGGRKKLRRIINLAILTLVDIFGIFITLPVWLNGENTYFFSFMIILVIAVLFLTLQFIWIMRYKGSGENKDLKILAAVSTFIFPFMSSVFAIIYASLEIKYIERYFDTK